MVWPSGMDVLAGVLGDRMTIDWVVVSAVTQVAGVFVVVASLVFVGVQVRQNTQAIETGSRQGMLDNDLSLISDYIVHAVDPHLISDDAKLTMEDERRFIWIVIKAIRIREFAWRQYKAGILDEATWQSYMAPVAGIFSTKRGMAVLEFYIGDPEFMHVLRDAVASGRVTSIEIAADIKEVAPMAVDQMPTASETAATSSGEDAPGIRA